MVGIVACWHGGSASGGGSGGTSTPYRAPLTQRPTSLTQSWTYRAECENSGSVLESVDTVYSPGGDDGTVIPPTLIQPPVISTPSTTLPSQISTGIFSI